MSEELKSCPFCGETPAIHKLDDGVSIACYHDEDNKISVDDGCIHRVFIAGSNEIDAISAWNTRQEPDDLIRTVKTRINELEEQIEENCTYRSRELVNHEIVVLKWVLSLRKPEDK